jgi:tetratricopeptide (TPR) repeat protein
MGSYDEALTEFQRAIQLDPNHTWTIANRGETYRLLGQYDEALTDLNQVIHFNPDYTWAIANRAETFRAMGRYGEALTDLNHVIQLDPNYTWAITSRAETYRLLGRYDEALTDFQRAARLDPKNTWTITGRGRTCRLLGRYDEALTDLRHATQLRPDDAESRYEYGIVLRLTKSDEDCEQWRTAERILTDKAAGEGTDAIDGRASLLAVLCALRDWPAAMDQAELLLAANPGKYRITDTLTALADLTATFPADTGEVEPIRHRLNRAIGA